MPKKNRKVGAVVAAIVLGMNFESRAIADPQTQVAFATKSPRSASQLRGVPVSEWGWWVRKDWESYQRKGLTHQAKNMLKKAAGHGNAQAQYVLGLMYANLENDERALYWLDKATRQGHTSAKFAYDYYLNDADDLGIGC